MILCLETATTLCSVALCNADGVVASRESRDSKSHASLLTVFAGEVLAEAGVKPFDLEAVAVSKGPGSYTGLRIGVSAAKGISFAASIPLIGVETTKAMFMGMQEKLGIEPGSDLLFCPVLDARRMEVYYAIYDAAGKTISEIKAEIINEDSFRTIAGKKRLIIFGDGATKLKPVVKSGSVSFDEDFRMSAAHLLTPAFEALRKKEFEDVAYFEPLYLKDFIATVSKKNIFGT